MNSEKRDIVIHYDEESQKIIFFSTNTSNTQTIRAKEFDGVCPEVEFFKTLPPDVAEQKLGGMLFALLDLHSRKKVGIRDYAAEAEEANQLWVQELLRVFDLSGFVARQLSGRHSAPKGVRHETNGSATGDTEDEIQRSV